MGGASEQRFSAAIRITWELKKKKRKKRKGKERGKPMLRMHPRTTESEFLKNGGSMFLSDSEPLLLFSISNSPVFPAGSLI